MTNITFESIFMLYSRSVGREQDEREIILRWFEHVMKRGRIGSRRKRLGK